MAENKKSFIIYTSWKIWLDGLNNEQKGMWLNWMMDYCNDFNPDYPKDQAVKIACMMAQDTLKRDLKKYEERKERMQLARNLNPNNNKSLEINTKETDIRQISVSNQSVISSVNVNDNVNVNVNDNVLDKSNNKENNTNKISVKEKPTSSRFYPPTLDEIKAYCDERRNLVDVERFYDFYSSKGWMVGKNKMKDWKAAVRTWEKEAGFKVDPQLEADLKWGTWQRLDETDEEYKERMERIEEAQNGGFRRL